MIEAPEAAKNSLPPDNLDRAVINQCVSTGSRNVALEMNPALIRLGAMLLGGSPGDLSIGFTAPSESVQGNGVVSGGTLASMLDHAMALSLLSRLAHGRSCATISLTINMLEPGRLGGFTANARVKRLGGRIAFLEADLHDTAGGRCVATATASFAIIEVRN